MPVTAPPIDPAPVPIQYQPIAPAPDPIRYHVSLCSPMRIKLQGHSTWFNAFDAVVADSGTWGLHPMAAMTFRSDRIYLSIRNWPRPSARDADTPLATAPAEVGIVTTLVVPVSNIAGLVPQPFKDR